MKLNDIRVEQRITLKCFNASAELENLISNFASISGHGREKQLSGKAKSNSKGRKTKQDLDFFLCDEGEPKKENKQIKGKKSER